MSDVTFSEAIEAIANRFGINLHYEPGAPSSGENRSLRKDLLEIHQYAERYFHERFLDDHEDSVRVRTYWEVERRFPLDLAQEFKIGFAPVDDPGLLSLLQRKEFTIEALKKCGLFYFPDRTSNLDAFRPLVEISKNNGVQRFIFASTSSVYGIKEEKDVHEDMSLEPLTDYSRYKADCEKILAEYQSDNFTTVTIRPATVCGYSPRQRLDVVVNILTNLAYHKREISIFGGDQLRPNVHIKDMVEAVSYTHLTLPTNREV